MIRLSHASPKAVRYACLNFHYAKVVPCAMYSYNVYNDSGDWCGVILYGNGAMGINSPFGLLNGEVLELVRVTLNGKQSCTSECVAASLRQLHKDAPHVKVVVSYADIDQGHVGTIYQATNWIYLGKVQVGGKGGYIIHGKKLHSKTVYSNGWKSDISWIRKNVDPSATIVRTFGKHKYIWVYNKKLRKQYQSLAVPYPKKSTLE